ncbi:MAG: N-acyl homoserine lactonase family protein [Ardenticatenaceae bacterium]|nr:N-acyl homoserine lactonase family protein [Ardenticatenaceae bacterium]
MMKPTPTTLAPIQTTQTSSGIKIHAVQTGWVSVKSRHVAYRGLDIMRLPAIILDRKWTPWLPILTWVIEHPEGVIVIDTGETHRINDQTYIDCDPGTRFVYSKQLQFEVSARQEIGPQLERLGIPTNEVRWVIQTHLHSDHMGGMRYFPRSEFILSPIDYPHGRGALYCRYPDWLNPTFTTFQADPDFEQSMTVTKAGDVKILPTPGHSNGHQSVLLCDSQINFFFAGDTSFSEKQLWQKSVGGISEDMAAAGRTLGKIRQFCRDHPTVYLPSHDRLSVDRLLGHQISRDSVNYKTND